ncbi:hypothetical protein TURU_090963 [Turdus rufiventris]|nr:hypothetical protein TURU_090963 [Turdus rufiventris]
MPPPLSPPQLSQSLLESLVAVVDTLGKVAAPVAGPEGDVELKGSQGSLQKALDPFTKNLGDALDRSSATALGKALAKAGTTPGATQASVTSAATDWQDSVKEVVKEWNKLFKNATELLSDCKVAAAMSSPVDTKDLQEKVDRWLNSVDNLITETWQLPWVTDEEKEAAALEKYKDKVRTAKKNTLVALQAMEEAVRATSQAKAATKAAERAKKAVEPLKALVDACAEVIKMFQELSCTVGDIKATLEGTKGESPSVPKDLVAKVAQAERLWRASDELVNCHLDDITGDIRDLLWSDPGSPGAPTGQMVARKCRKAKEAIPGLLKKVMSP